MAGVRGNVNSGTTTLVANVEKTLVQLKAAANHRVRVHGIKLLGEQPAGGQDVPVSVRLTFSSANFGTSSAATPGKSDPSQPETIQATAAKTFTVEPTSPTDSGLAWRVQPQNGVIEFLPPGMTVDIPGGYALNVQATSSGTPKLLATLIFEE